MHKKLFVFLFFVLFSNCTKPPLDTTKCDNFKKPSKEYISCMNDTFSSTNTVSNLKEFKKHKTLKSFFKQVEVIPSD